MRAAIYARVSTNQQTVENQIADLRKMAQVYDWTIVCEYIDSGISGSEGRDSRPQFDKLCDDIMDRNFDVVIVGADRQLRHRADISLSQPLRQELQ